MFLIESETATFRTVRNLQLTPAPLAYKLPTQRGALMRYPAIAIAIFCCLTLAAPARLSAQEEHEHEGEHHHHGAEVADLGTVVFPTSCTGESQKAFERAVAL